MNTLIVGNMGYVGPVVIQHLRRARPHDTLTGLDIGYFAHCLLGESVWPDCYLDRQIVGDIRHIQPEWLEGVDAIVNLAAISNDPMGDRSESARR